MKKTLLLLWLGWFSFVWIHAEGTLRGKITDENGEPLIGAIVVHKDQPTLGVVAGNDGSYNLKLPARTTHTILVKFVGYHTIEEIITLKDNEIAIKNFTLVPDSKAIDAVVVSAKAKRANDTYMQLVKSRSAVSLDYISSETIKRTGDTYATDAIKRVTGVSTIGGFVSVRGLADRYIKTAVNGLRIPTLDPITNNIKLDMFPTFLVDNIVITKTVSPDLPGDWTGSYVSIETKDYPEKLMVGMSTTIGYNAQSSFQEIVTSKQSKTDWLGFDNGFRDIYRAGYNSTYPAYYGDAKLLPYHEFSALGLGDFIGKHGLSESTLGVDSRNNLDYYYRLCLAELGLLEPGLIDDLEAVQAAENRFNAEYKDLAYTLVNTPVTEFGESMPDNWGTIKKRAPLSFSQEISIGDQWSLFKRPFGFNLGLRYGSGVRYDPDATAQIAKAPENGGDDYVNVKRNYQASSLTYNWSALLNMAYAFSKNHSISLMCMPNFSGVNSVREGYVRDNNTSAYDTLTYGISQYYEERRQLIYQAQTSSYFPVLKLKVDLSASYTDGESSIPDSKSLKLYPNEDHFVYNPSDYEYKKSTYLFEDVFDSRLVAELTLNDKPGLVRKLKFGGAYQYNKRDNEIYRFYLLGGSSQGSVINSPSEVNDAFSEDKFSIETQDFYYYQYEYNPMNFVTGTGKISSAYMMIDYAFMPALRVSGGLRFEYTDIFTDVKLFDELNLPPNHPDRKPATQGGGVNLPSAEPGVLVHYNYLPSINLIYRIHENEKINLTARFNYSQSIARPSIRELTPLYQEDFILQKEILGNPKLKIAEIDNYDFRLESFFANGDNISVSLFYKKFWNHIEMVDVPYTTWKNAEEAEAYGIEWEFLKKLGDNFDLRANVTWIESYAKIQLEQGMVTHPMFGQAPYIVNAILGYTSEKSRLSASLSYNVQGQKLALVTVKSNYVETSDIYELPQHLLDFKISKFLGKHFNIAFRVRNILNSPVVRAYDFSKAGLIDYDRYTYGTDYMLTLSINL